jgi:hypothetical protein
VCGQDATLNEETHRLSAADVLLTQPKSKVKVRDVELAQGFRRRGGGQRPACATKSFTSNGRGDSSPNRYAIGHVLKNLHLGYFPFDIFLSGILPPSNPIQLALTFLFLHLATLANVLCGVYAGQQINTNNAKADAVAAVSPARPEELAKKRESGGGGCCISKISMRRSKPLLLFHSSAHVLCYAKEGGGGCVV